MWLAKVLSFHKAVASMPTVRVRIWVMVLAVRNQLVSSIQQLALTNIGLELMTFGTSGCILCPSLTLNKLPPTLPDSLMAAAV